MGGRDQFQDFVNYPAANSDRVEIERDKQENWDRQRTVLPPPLSRQLTLAGYTQRKEREDM